MKITPFAILVGATLAGCTELPLTQSDHVTMQAPNARPTATAHSLPAARALGLDSYKEALARQISAVSAAQVYPGRPQALLRSVIVLRFVLDAHGNLLRSETVRSNHDRATESVALASLRNAAPFPAPSGHLLAHGKVELSETWLFNNDGRFQLRSIAAAQMTEPQ